MKKLIVIPILFLCFSAFGQVKEKWVDTDSLNAEAFVFKSTEIDTMYGDTIVNKNYVDNVTPDLDSINSTYANIQRANIDTFNLGNSVDLDTVINISDVTYSDTILFLNVNWLIKPDSSYATDKSWNWIYNLGKP